MRSLLQCLVATVLLLGVSATAGAQQLSKETVEKASPSEGVNKPGAQSAAMLKAQILLDRAHVSPGAIDGMAGENSFRAIKAFRQMHGLDSDGKLDDEVWRKLTDGAEPVLTSYEITKKDVDGPFLDSVPDDLESMAELDRLSYTSPLELLAEKFHMDQKLLQQLNPDVDFGAAGTKIIVADVRKGKPQKEVARIEVDKSREAVVAYAEDGSIIAYYPATIGSRELPSPSGETKVVGIASSPTYYYSPKLDFEGAPDKDLKIAPGPNNPVGSMWIDLDKEGYGLHGTPNPEQIGKEASHGCVRMTNWDAQELGELARSGIPVVFTD